jgi:hypothetical protein
MKTDGQEPARLEGRYANALKVGHNAFEFLLEFGQTTEDDSEVRCLCRIVTSPAYAKAFLQTLQESIERYEETFGRIPWLSD